MLAPANTQTGHELSSKDIAEATGKGHKTVLRDIRKMLADLYGEDGTDLYHPGIRIERDIRDYISLIWLDREHAMTLATGYDVKLRKRVVDKLAELDGTPARLPTTAEAFANVFQMVADQERRGAEQDRQLRAISADIQLIKDTAPLTAKPQNAESLSEVRKRTNRRYGLPQRIIDAVMGDLPYSPRPFQMVKNSHENAKGSSYAVWRIIDVTKLFARFVGECTMVTATQAIHPDIESRFKLTGKAGV